MTELDRALQTAIQHTKEVIEGLEEGECLDEHKQLLGWLKDLKHLRLQKSYLIGEGEHQPAVDFTVDCYTERCWKTTPGFAENSYYIDGFQDLVQTLADVSQIDTGIRKVLIHINRPYGNLKELGIYGEC